MLYFLLFFSFYLIFPSPIFASSGLSLSPPTVEIILSPNKSITQAFTLTNQGEKADFVVNLHRVTPIDSYGHVTLSSTPTTLFDPLIISLLGKREFNAPFTLLEGETTELIITLTALDFSIPSDQYLALVITQIETNFSSTTHTLPSLSSLLFITLASPTESLPISLELTDFSPPLFHDPALPLTLSPTLHNQAQTMLRTQGKLQLFTPTNKLSKTIKLYPSLSLAGGNRTLISYTISGECPEELTSVTSLPTNCLITPLPLSLDFSPLAIGPHRLTLSIQTIGSQEVLSQEKIIWLFPFRAIITIILLAIIIYILLIILKYKRQTKMNQTT